MAHKVKSAVKPRVSTTPPPAPQSLRRRMWRPSLLLAVAACVALIVTFPTLEQHLPNLHDQPEYRVASTRIQITQPPRWVPPDLVEQVIQNASLPEELSLLDDYVTTEIAEAFQLHPWVEEVVSVTKSVPGTIRVKLNYRAPVAMVEVKQGMYPVDKYGILLPPENFSVADTKQYPLLQNIVSTPQGPAGTGWGDPIVASGAKLASVLAPHWKALRLVAIVCPRQAEGTASDAGQFVLTAAGESRIVWGRAPGVDHPGELSVEQKIGRLKKYVADFGGFDQPHGPYEIDIRPWQEIVRRPATAWRDDASSSRE